MRKSLILSVVCSAFFLPTHAQEMDSLRVSEATALAQLLQEGLATFRVPHYRPSRPMGIDSLRLDNDARQLDLFMNEVCRSYTFTPTSQQELHDRIRATLPAEYGQYSFRVFGTNGRLLSDYIPNFYRGTKPDRARLWRGLNYSGAPWTQNISLPYYPTHGLKGHHLFVTPSHGRIYKNALNAWGWQRPYLFCTTEDLFTQSLVNPYLIPMLESAGAVVFSARERDSQTAEAVVDNDDMPDDTMGSYREVNSSQAFWETLDGIPAFAMPTSALTDSIQPFTLGTVRAIRATRSKKEHATATWIPNLPRNGQYAVYVSYTSRSNSIPDAHYIVRHKGGETHFLVNQQMGGGTWVYLGTFQFDAGQHLGGSVMLTNKSNHHGIVTADAVRFGGGYGRNVRGDLAPTGLPRHLECARSYVQWAGLPDSLYSQFGGANDYNDDIRCRPHMLNWLGGGSTYLPDRNGGGVPFEVALAVHSDAGYRHDNSIVGTLGICTTETKEKNTYPAGISRQSSADLNRIMLHTIANDISETFHLDWSQREAWDRNYGESRIPELPSMILETLSHQNFADLRYGHDPNFKFALTRAIYKALLRYVNAQHGRYDVAVQPLPVNQFSALIDGSDAQLEWQPTIDFLEPTAVPTHYVLYVARGDSAFDNGRIVNGTSVRVPLQEGVPYDFRITAVNGGGESFPSETLSVCRVKDSQMQVLIVNGFERVSGPAWINTSDSLGFDLLNDVGVPYLHTTAFAGYQKCFDRSQAGSEGEAALGYCGDELVGKIITGNTFNYPVLHGAAIAEMKGVSFSSCSKQAAKHIDWNRFHVIDYIAGLERDASHNLKSYKTFDAAIRRKMENYHGGLLVSGAFIGSDMRLPEEKDFIHNVLKYDFVLTERNDSMGVNGLRIHLPLSSEFNDSCYAVQQYDVLSPVSPAFAAFAYSTGYPAGIAYAGSDRRVIAMGFPFEAITDAELRSVAMRAILKFLIKQS